MTNSHKPSRLAIPGIPEQKYQEYLKQFSEEGKNSKEARFKDTAERILPDWEKRTIA